MRCLVVSLMLLVAMLSLPGAQAQEDAPLAEDSEGDVEAKVAGTQVQLLAEQSSQVDLTALYVEEQVDGFLVRVHVADLGDDTSTFLDSSRVEVRFKYHGLQFVAELADGRGPLGESFGYGQLYVVETDDDGYESRDYRSSLDVTIDRSEHYLEALLPREAMTDERGAPPNRGDLLEEFWVSSHGVALNIRVGPAGSDPAMQVGDRMPDEGDVGPVEVKVGVRQEGNARLSSDAPFRLSNGGASTIVYEVAAANRGERQVFDLGVDQVPDGWGVSLPFDRFVMDEGENTSFPVLLTTPSGHSHGGLDKFLLTMTGQRDDGDVGRIELGLKYTDIPQPAGHHPRLYFHSHEPYGGGAFSEVDALFGGGVFSYVEAYMNAAETDPGDAEIPVPGRGNSLPAFGGYFDWFVPMSPSLGMGLDFRTKEQATMELPIQYDYIAEDVVVWATLNYWDPERGDRILIATSEPTEPTSWSQGTHRFEVTLDIEEEADFLAYVDGARLDLHITMEGDFLGPGPFGPGANPSLVPGGYMDLPLREYRDPVDTFYKAAQGLRFGSDFLEQPVNPGKSWVFETTLRNDGAETEPVRLNLTGVHDEWARILGEHSFTLSSGQSRTVAVAVTIPEDMADGAAADLILQAVSDRDAHQRAVIDLVAIVDTDGEHPDASSRIEELDRHDPKKKAPGFEIAAVALGLLAIALVLRRRPW